MGLTKAKLVVEKESGKTTIDVMFNPTEYQLNDSANYSDKNIPGVDGPVTQFVSGAASTLSLNLIMDTTIPYASSTVKGSKGGEFQDVSKQVRLLSQLTAIDGKQHRPPRVSFCWGSLNFRGIVTKVSQNYIMFAEDGKPLRAKVSLELKSIIELKNAKKKSPFESPDRTKYRVLEEGMQLWSLAYEEYGSCEHWRRIAEENGITNPLDVPVGRMLKIPPL